MFYFLSKEVWNLFELKGGGMKMVSIGGGGPGSNDDGDKSLTLTHSLTIVYIRKHSYLFDLW